MGFVLIVIALATATLAIQVPKVTFEAITTDDEFPYRLVFIEFFFVFFLTVVFLLVMLALYKS